MHKGCRLQSEVSSLARCTEVHSARGRYAKAAEVSGRGVALTAAAMRASSYAISSNLVQPAWRILLCMASSASHRLVLGLGLRLGLGLG